MKSQTDFDPKAMSRRIRLLRRRRKLSREEVAKRARIGVDTLGRYEQGQTMPTPKVCLALADAFDVAKRELLDLLPVRDEQTDFGRELRRLRLEHGLTQQELGRRIDAQAGLISKYENRMNYFPSPRILAGLVRVFDIPEKQLTDLMPKRPDTTPFGRALRDLRIERKMTQKQLADRIQCGHGLIANYEIGRMQPGTKNLNAIAAALRVPRKQLRTLVGERGAEKHATAFGKALREARLAKNMTQRDLAKALKLRAGTITSYETANIYPAKKLIPDLIERASATLDLSQAKLKELLAKPRRNYPTAFGQRLRELRVDHGLTQDQLAKTIGYGGGLISSYENGRTYPNAEVLAALAGALEVDPEELKILLPRLSTRPEPSPFGRELRRCRKERGLTQEALAERVGVGGVTIFNYEAGSTHPNLRVLAALAKALGASRKKFEELLPQQPVTTEFGKRIRQLRKQRELTQGQLAELIGCKQPSVSSYELGRKRPEPKDIVALSKALGVAERQLERWAAQIR